MDLGVKFKTILENTIGDEQARSKQEVVDGWWKTILDAYSQPQRHYHTVEHIRSMWSILDTVPAENISDINSLGFAIFFHEQVHRPDAWHY